MEDGDDDENDEEDDEENEDDEEEEDDEEVQRFGYVNITCRHANNREDHWKRKRRRRYQR